MNLNQVYRQVVMEHYKNKRSFYEMDIYTHKIHYKNPTCGDVMTMYANMEEDHIKELSFIGEGCSISMAASSMFTEIVKNKSLEEVLEISNLFEQMIKNGCKIDDERLMDLISLEGVHSLPARYNCALMPFQAFSKLIMDKGV
ncbi:Fe-S cluster assembly sulfur transfer protein SufU [Bacillus sp. 1P02SD]|uniref:Fe-S cluster assembly sulfur transfer protein SufU n=1 Tax=Bacillus sp. 1P02SD TaxID=3132264 RepID=UPI0039A0ED11